MHICISNYFSIHVDCATNLMPTITSIDANCSHHGHNCVGTAVQRRRGAAGGYTALERRPGIG